MVGIGWWEVGDGAVSMRMRGGGMVCRGGEERGGYVWCRGWLWDKRGAFVVGMGGERA